MLAGTPLRWTAANTTVRCCFPMLPCSGGLSSVLLCADLFSLAILGCSWETTRRVPSFVPRVMRMRERGLAVTRTTINHHFCFLLPPCGVFILRRGGTRAEGARRRTDKIKESAHSVAAQAGKFAGAEVGIGAASGKPKI